MILLLFFVTAALAQVPEAERYRNLGLTHLQQNEKTQAIVAFQTSLRLDPSQTSLHYQLGVLLLADKRYHEATSHLQKAYSLGLKNVSVLLNLARADFALGQPAEALQRIEELVSRQPRGARTYHELGELLFENLFYQRARQMFELARAADPDSYETTYYLALVNYLLDKFEESRELLDQMTRRGQATFEVENLLGSAQAKLGYFDQAIAAFRQAVALDPNRADSYFHLGLLYLETGDKKQAEEFLEKAGRIAGRRDVRVFYTLTRFSCDDESTPASGSDPAKAEYFYNLALVFQKRYHHTTALELLKLARQYESSSARIYFALGLSCFNLEPTAASARAFFARAAELEPASHAAHYFLGEAYARQGNNAAASQAYRKAMQLSPRTASYYLALAKVLQSDTDSVKMFEEAIALDPAQAPTYYELGRRYLKMGQPHRAISQLEKAIELAPDYFEAYYSLGLAYARIRNTQRAREIFEIFESKKKLVSEKATVKGGFARVE